MKEVRWFCNKHTGFIKTEDISKELRFFEELAKDVFSKGNADHVIYASKEYTKNGNDLECVIFHIHNVSFGKLLHSFQRSGTLCQALLYACLMLYLYPHH